MITYYFNKECQLKVKIMKSMLNDPKFAMLALNYVKGLGPVWMRRLLEYFEYDPTQIWQANREDRLNALQGRENLVDSLENVSWKEVEKEYALTQQLNINLVSSNAPDYPQQLANIYDAPQLFYRLGTWKDQDQFAIAIVGTRRASFYGIRQAHSFAKELASKQVTVISGLARGVDIAAHRGAISAGGRTIAVLGSGLQKIYPPEHRQDAQEIAKHGCIISEYPLYADPIAPYFPQRNRIISGLSLGIIVIEAGEKSGALITAHNALEQGREVFAIPGQIDRNESVGCHRLIQQGAKLVTCIDDVLQEIQVLQDKVTSPQPMSNQILIESLLEDLNENEKKLIENYPSESPTLQYKYDNDKELENFKNLEERNKSKTLNKENTISQLTFEQQKIWEVLTQYPCSIDEIISMVDLSPAQVSSNLLMMEIQGIIHLFPGHRYAKKCN